LRHSQIVRAVYNGLAAEITGLILKKRVQRALVLSYRVPQTARKRRGVNFTFLKSRKQTGCFIL
jgi:hypothetical protein